MTLAQYPEEYADEYKRLTALIDGLQLHGENRKFVGFTVFLNVPWMVRKVSVFSLVHSIRLRLPTPEWWKQLERVTT